MDVAAVRVSIFLEDGRPGELFLAIIFYLRVQLALIASSNFVVVIMGL